MLIAIKLLHTLIWTLFASGIFALFPLAIRSRFRSTNRAAVIISIGVWIECAVVVVNGWKCPLTDWAARYTSDRSPNFDIYLPVWLAQYNKVIFGTLFALSQLLLLVRWLGTRRSVS